MLSNWCFLRLLDIIGRGGETAFLPFGKASMRWRLYIFLLSATAVFCFMLLTATTDYGAGKFSGSRTMSATTGQGLVNSKLLTAIVAEPAEIRPAAPSRREVRSDDTFNLAMKPNPVRPFVPASADPVLARHDAEREERASRGKPANRRRLKWDERGWYREEVALVTAYCPCSRCCGSQANGITSIGKDAWTPGLAAEPDYLAYGTKVFVPGYGFSEIDDTGGAMRRHWKQNGLLHLDVRMTYHREARIWGKQYLRVKIYEAN